MEMEQTINQLLQKVAANAIFMSEHLNRTTSKLKCCSTNVTPELKRNTAMHLISVMKNLVEANYNLETALDEFKMCICHCGKQAPDQKKSTADSNASTSSGTGCQCKSDCYETCESSTIVGSERGISVTHNRENLNSTKDESAEDENTTRYDSCEEEFRREEEEKLSDENDQFNDINNSLEGTVMDLPQANNQLSDSCESFVEINHSETSKSCSETIQVQSETAARNTNVDENTIIASKEVTIEKETVTETVALKNDRPYDEEDKLNELFEEIFEKIEVLNSSETDPVPDQKSEDVGETAPVEDSKTDRDLIQTIETTIPEDENARPKSAARRVQSSNPFINNMEDEDSGDEFSILDYRSSSVAESFEHIPEHEIYPMKVESLIPERDVIPPVAHSAQSITPTVCNAHSSDVKSEEKPMKKEPTVEPPKTNPAKKCTAVQKLANATIYDRRKEVLKKLESNKQLLPNTFTLVPAEEPASVKIPSKSSDSKKKRHGGDDLPVTEIPESTFGVNMKCTFGFIESPGQFYLHTNRDLVASLQTDLNEEYSERYFGAKSAFKTKSDARAAIGDYGVAYITDKKGYHRVRVVDWLCRDGFQTDNIYCQLIDHGDKVFCSYRSLKKLHGMYAKIEKLAIKCRFAHLNPINGTTSWPDIASDALRDIVFNGQHEHKKFFVIYAQKDGDAYAVDLFEEGDVKHSLSEKLILAGLARQDAIAPSAEENDSELVPLIALNGTAPAEPAEPVFDEGVVEYDNICEAISGYDARDEARICPFTRPDGACYKGPRCKLEHKKLSADGITTDTVLSFTSAFVQIDVPLGQWVDIVITGYINVCQFYAHIVTTPSAPGQMFNDYFQNLLDKMNSPSQVQTYEPLPSHTLPGVGELVLVFHHVKQWFRATYLRPGHDINQVEVFLVDFGSQYTADVKNLRQMKNDFLHIPFQAVECILTKYRAKPNIDSERACKFFLDEICFKPFQAYISATNVPVPMDVKDSDGHYMGIILQQFGFAEPRLEDLNPSQDCPLQDAWECN